MQISGAGAWRGFLDVDDFVGKILDVVLECWPEIATPATTEREDVVTQRLCARILDSPQFRTLFLRVYPHPVDLSSSGEVTGVPDIRFETNAPQHEVEFLVIECKRLRYEAGGRCRSNNTEYIDGQAQGMTAFVNEKYKTPHGHGGMIGYILCTCSDPIPGLTRAVRKSGILGLAQGDSLRSSTLRPCPEVRETFHSTSAGRNIRLHHVFLDSEKCAG